MEEINILIRSYLSHPAGAAFAAIILTFFAHVSLRGWLTDLDEGHEERLLSCSDKSEEHLRYIAQLTKRMLHFVYSIYIIAIGVLIWAIVFYMARN